MRILKYMLTIGGAILIQWFIWSRLPGYYLLYQEIRKEQAVRSRVREFIYEPLQKGRRNNPATLTLVDETLRKTIINYFVQKYNITQKSRLENDPSRPNGYETLRNFCDYKTYGTIDNETMIIGHITYECNAFYLDGEKLKLYRGGGLPTVLFIEPETYKILGFEALGTIRHDIDGPRMFPEGMQPPFYLPSDQRHAIYEQAEEYFGKKIL